MIIKLKIDTNTLIGEADSEKVTINHVSQEGNIIEVEISTIDPESTILGINY